MLSLEIIDDTGEVVDTVYVGEITGTSGTLRAVQPACSGAQAFEALPAGELRNLPQIAFGEGGTLDYQIHAPYAVSAASSACPGCIAPRRVFSKSFTVCARGARPTLGVCALSLLGPESFQ